MRLSFAYRQVTLYFSAQVGQSVLCGMGYIASCGMYGLFITGRADVGSLDSGLFKARNASTSQTQKEHMGPKSTNLG
ncbi:MAG: hypothetical protein NXI32_06100 [bacterium]|nr:hypothetical protein [bacterium]